MSTHLFGDVELITKQEAQAMIEASTLTENQVDAKIAANKAEIDVEIGAVSAAVEQERTTRENEKIELDDRIDDETALRNAGDERVQNNLDQEASVRQQADAELVQAIEDFKTFESQVYPNAFVERLKGLPIAFLTVHNTDKSLHIGDTIATIDHPFFPRRAHDFIMYVEQIDPGTGNDKTVMLLLRLDNDGNINVINMLDVAFATAATDTITTMYFTED